MDSLLRPMDSEYEGPTLLDRARWVAGEGLRLVGRYVRREGVAVAIEHWPAFSVALLSGLKGHAQGDIAILAGDHLDEGRIMATTTHAHAAIVEGWDRISPDPAALDAGAPMARLDAATCLALNGLAQTHRLADTSLRPAPDPPGSPRR